MTSQRQAGQHHQQQQQQRRGQRRQRQNGQSSRADDADAAAGGEGEGRQQQQQQQQDQQPNLMDSMLHILLLVCLFQFISSSASLAYERWGPNANSNSSVVVEVGPDVVVSSSSSSATHQQQRRPVGADGGGSGGGGNVVELLPGEGPHTCLWPFGTIMDLDVLVTHDRIPPPPPAPITGKSKSPPPKSKSKSSSVLVSWHEGGLVYANAPSNNARNSTLRIPLSREMLKNETEVYAHIYLTRRSYVVAGMMGGRTTGGGGGDGEDVDVMIKTVTLTRYKLRKKAREERSLLGEDDDSSSPTSSKAKKIDYDIGVDNSTVLGGASLDRSRDVTLLYVVPSLTLQLVTDMPPTFPRRGIPPQMIKWMDFKNRTTEGADSASSSGTGLGLGLDLGLGDDYYPVLYPSEFWMRSDSLHAINGTLDEMTLDVSVDGIRMWKWQLMAQMEETWRMQDQMNGGQDGGDSDLLRSLLMDTNPWLLGVTVLVSILHSAFDFLAFKNDISFFKGKKSMEGLSLRTMVVNSFFQVVIFLYLLDNDTSFMVLASNGIGLAIEFWKISKAVTFSVCDGKITWEEAATYKKSRTKEYDEIATSHLLFVTMPLVAGYGVYSLRYMKHKGWYSWILSTLVGFIYMFGFVMMTPQLFINYKLQSVAHMNHRTMMYKFLNTFVDDLFAFVIKMPIMHRLACLRDDLIYFIFLYQRWKYRTDYTRVNEYGQCAVTSPANDGADDAIKPRIGTEAEGVGSKNDVQLLDHTAPGSRTEKAENGVRRRRGAREKRSLPQESPDQAHQAAN